MPTLHGSCRTFVIKKGKANTDLEIFSGAGREGGGLADVAEIHERAGDDIICGITECGL